MTYYIYINTNYMKREWISKTEYWGYTQPVSLKVFFYFSIYKLFSYINVKFNSLHILNVFNYTILQKLFNLQVY